MLSQGLTVDALLKVRWCAAGRLAVGITFAAGAFAVVTGFTFAEGATTALEARFGAFAS